ncbi:hypothetical protein GCM10009838_61660 [Catenulispora subtropica]|uniref:Uncharacterized protein n=1 Tax=Catenulispora subtropica TaxID=450798 RepID=A0ABN2SPN8_9ACTN
MTRLRQYTRPERMRANCLGDTTAMTPPGHRCECHCDVLQRLGQSRHPQARCKQGKQGKQGKQANAGLPEPGSTVFWRFCYLA